MEISAREMEIIGINPKNCANFDVDAAIPPVLVEDHCAVQLVSIPRKVFDLLQDDIATREVVHQIQMSTGALIKPVDRESSRLLPGQHIGPQKPRKEYFLQVSGTAAQVERAKDDIERNFKNSQAEERVSLKMDVSFSDHSFIIGRFGRGIQNVSHETNCLIHFPDSNKNKQYEKSNQVSISGPPEGVLEARRRIRKLLPISFAFVIAGPHHHEAMYQSAPQIFETRPRVQEMINMLQNEHRITITMLPMHNLQTSAALVTVRGRHANIDRIKEGILKLMAFLVPDNPSLAVYVGIEVSPHHLEFVTGPNNIKLCELMRDTNTTIEIPDIPERRQSIPTVRIVGQVLNVYQAWVKFMDLLPLALLVEIPFDASPLQELPPLSSDGAWSVGEESLTPLTEDPAFGAVSSFGASRIDDIAHALNEHLETFDITLISRQKSREIRDTTRQWWLVIKGPEKYVDIMFEIHKSLNKDDPVEHVLSFIRTLPEPRHRFGCQPVNRLGIPPSSSNVDLCYRPGAAALASAWGMSNAQAQSTVRQRPLPVAWPQEESPSSMTSTPIKPSIRQHNSQAESSSAPSAYWKTPSEGLSASFLTALEESMDSMRLGGGRSSASGCGERDSAMNRVSHNGYQSFRAPPTRSGPILGASAASSGGDQARCSGLSTHSLFDDEILRDVLNEMPLSGNIGSDLGSCATASSSSFDPSAYGTALFPNPSEAYFVNSKRSTYKEQSRNSLLSGYGTDSGFASRSTKNSTMDIDSTSPLNSNLGTSDSGYSVLKEGFGDLDFDSMFFKTGGDRSSNPNRYNLWGQDSTRARNFDAAPGSGREAHS